MKGVEKSKRRLESETKEIPDLKKISEFDIYKDFTIDDIVRIKQKNYFM